MYANLFLIHKYSVLLFLAIYIIKTALLLLNKNGALANFTKIVKVPEMIVSFSFLATGIYLIFNYPYFGIMMVIKLVAVFAAIPLAIIGFKKGNKILATLSLVLIFAAYGIAEMNKKLGPKKAIAVAQKENTPANSLELGKSIYISGCQACHGENGDAGIAGAANLAVSTLSLEEALLVVKKGKKSMPAFGYLSEEEQLAVVGYIGGLRK